MNNSFGLLSEAPFRVCLYPRDNKIRSDGDSDMALAEIVDVRDGNQLYRILDSAKEPSANGRPRHYQYRGDF